jgi:hypothetical protein
VFPKRNSLSGADPDQASQCGAEHRIVLIGGQQADAPIGDGGSQHRVHPFLAD